MNKETIDLKLLHYFNEAAKTLNFTQASSQLGIPKSALSKGIAKLEGQLGERLFERSSRVVNLTETGQLLFQRAALLLEESSLLLSDIKAMQQNVAGQLNLAAPPVLGRFIASQIIPGFMGMWPQIRITLNLSYKYENLPGEGLDLAFRMGDNRDENLIERNLGLANRVMVASPAYLDSHSSIIELDDIREHQGLHFRQGQYQNVWSVGNGQQTQQIELDGPFQCEDLDAVTQAAIAGLGIAQLPWLLVRDAVERNDLKVVLPQWTSPVLPISLVYRQGYNKSRRLAEFLQWIEQHRSAFDLRYPVKSQQTLPI